MKKNHYSMVSMLLRVWKCKTLLVMRLTLLICLFFALQSIAIETFSQNKRLSINQKNIRIEDILQLIENKTDYYFMYSAKAVDVERTVDIEATDKLVSEILDDIFKGTNVSYKVDGRLIALSKNGEESVMGQQPHSVSGKVTDSSGSPLPGVTVVLKGTTTGTITDSGGKYNLTNVPANATLIFSFVGMKTQEITVAGNSLINVILAEESFGIDEIVAVGYGTQKKETLTGAIASVSGKDIIATRNENVVNQLVGKVPGLRVKAATSEPGANNSIYDIRGFGNPLIVIDGVPQSDNSNFTRMNSEEIESLTVLKDASAAVYGVRAANGVILITTKMGNSSTAKFKYDGSYSLQVPTNEPNLMDAVSYMTLFNEFQRSNTLGTGGANSYSDDEIAAYANGTKTGTDWYGLAMKSFAPQQQHNLSASGGSNTAKYYVSIGYLGQDGLPSSEISTYKRYNFRTNVSAELNKYLTADIKVSGIKDDQQQPTHDGMFAIYKSMWRQSPLDKAWFDDAQTMPMLGADSSNPYVITDINNAGYLRTGNMQASAVGSLVFKVPWIEGLNAKALYSYDYRNNDIKNWSKQMTMYNTDGSKIKAGNQSNLTKTTNSYNNSMLQLSFDYTKSIEKHNIKALALYEESSRNGDGYYVQRLFTLDALDELFAGSPTNIQGSSSSGMPYTYTNKGFVGRVNYDYNNRYLLEGSFRYDGSSKFMSGHQWGFFPSASVGWRLSEENFWKTSLIDYIDNFKIRASYGKVGDDSGAAYQWVNGYIYPSGSIIWNGANVSGSASTGIPNENITWYTATSKDLGIDISYKHNLIALSADVFQRNRDGLLGYLSSSVPGIFGATFGAQNLNSDMTRGFEITLSHSNKIGDLKYTISGNMSYTRTMNKYVERSPSLDQLDNWKNNTNNRWSGISWGYKTTGQFQSVQEAWDYASYAGINSVYTGNQYVLPSDLKVEDWNGDGIIDSNDYHPIDSYVNSTAPIYFGGSISMNYKGFDLNIMLQGATGNYFARIEQLVRPIQWNIANGLDIFTDRWHTVNSSDNPFDPNTQWISGTYPTTHQSITESTSYSYYWEDVSYLRLKSVELGYTLSSGITKKIGIETLRIYLSGYNLLTLSPTKLIDPERSSSNYSYVYPLTKTFTLGVNLTF